MEHFVSVIVLLAVSGVISGVSCYHIESRAKAHTISTMAIMLFCIAIDQFYRDYWQGFGYLALVAGVSAVFGFVFSFRISSYIGYKVIDSSGNQT